MLSVGWECSGSGIGGSGCEGRNPAKAGLADRRSACRERSRDTGGPPSIPQRAEVITTPSQAAPLPPRSLPGDAESGQVLRLPAVTENPQPPSIPPAEPTESDQALPINLATALYLSNARPLVIAFAQTRVEEAAALLQNARVLWLPNLNVGADYYRHDGTDQSTDGTIIVDDKTAVAAGGGATLSFAVTDAIFCPLAARQELAASESDLQTARNDALLDVALAYFDVQQTRNPGRHARCGRQG